MSNPAFIQIRYLDGLRYQRAILAGCKEIISYEKELNKINVFPVPDKDTGSNLKKTLLPIIEQFPLWEIDKYIEDNDIYFVPVKFQAMDKVYTDKVNIIPEEFYQIMSSSPENAIEDIEIFIGFPTLKYLVKGGRITKTKGLIAKILNINPILTINREGAFEPIGKTRGKKRLDQKLFDIAFEKVKKATMDHPEVDLNKMAKEKSRFSVAVAHTNAPQSGKRISEKIEERLGQRVVMTMNASPVLGAHAGPGAVGIAFLFLQNPDTPDPDYKNS